MNNLATENYLRCLSYNADVLVVGGSELTKDEQDELSKDYNLIVRINNHYVRQDGRVDVLYTSGTQQPESELTNSVIVECRPLPDESESNWLKIGTANDNKYMRLDTNFYRDTNPFGGEHEQVNLLHKELRSIPLTGIIAVNHLCLMPIKSLTLIGYDFYSRAGIMPNSRDSHNLWDQAVWLYYKTMKDVRIRVTGKLLTLIQRAAEAKDYRYSKGIVDKNLYDTI